MNSQAIANRQKRLPLSLFRTLTVTDMHCSRVEPLGRQRGAHAGIHPATEQDYRTRFGLFYHFEHRTTESQRDQEYKEQALTTQPALAQEFAALPLLSLCLCDSVVKDSYALHRRVPDELMNLQSQAGRNVVPQHPLCQFPGIKQTVRAVACAA